MFNSVHLQNFPNLSSIVIDEKIVNDMDLVLDVCNVALSLRRENNIRVRLPLSKITVCGDFSLNNEYIELIKQEVNVKEIEVFNGNLDEIAKKEVILDMKGCGKQFGSRLKDILQAQKEGNFEVKNSVLYIAGVEIPENLFKITYKPNNGTKAVICSEHNVLVMMDTNITPELQIEGLARDLVRTIQQTRKDKNLQISDHIDTEIYATDDVFNNVINEWGEYIKEQTLSNNLELKKQEVKENLVEIDGYKFSVAISKK